MRYAVLIIGLTALKASLSWAIPVDEEICEGAPESVLTADRKFAGYKQEIGYWDGVEPVSDHLKDDNRKRNVTEKACLILVQD